MTEYQLMYLRFLQMREQFPELNHRGHEPGPDLNLQWENAAHLTDLMKVMELKEERRKMEREFYRTR